MDIVKRKIQKIIREEIEDLISEIKLSDYKTPSKPFVVRHLNDNAGKHDKFFATRQEAADYCYKIGLENVFDIGAIMCNGYYSWYNLTHLNNLIDKKEEEKERLRSLEKSIKKWKNDIADWE